MDFIFKVTGVVLIVALWQLIFNLGWFEVAIFPSPLAVLQALVGYFESGDLWKDLSISLLRGLVGLFIGAVFGIFIGMLTGRLRSLNLLLAPMLNFFRSLPPVAILPLFIIWFGIDDQAKINTIAFGCFFPVWLNTTSGASRISSIYLKNAKLLSKSDIKIFFKVEIPATLPFIVIGLRLAAATAFIMVFVSELAGANQGLGFTISNAQMNYQVDVMIAALLILAGTAACIDQLIKILSFWFFPWLKFND
ncbi:ABC transporter permease [Pedobacter aquatilis]|uniref:ABC transporter permease n=1 Tax=Pedobacter aquatilis TaxID=351343 RepID=UPI00293168FC|nr:ABC transporter permease [Pedobacter aquatilis]